MYTPYTPRVLRCHGQRYIWKPKFAAYIGKYLKVCPNVLISPSLFTRKIKNPQRPRETWPHDRSARGWPHDMAPDLTVSSRINTWYLQLLKYSTRLYTYIPTLLKVPLQDWWLTDLFFGDIVSCSQEGFYSVSILYDCNTYSASVWKMINWTVVRSWVSIATPSCSLRCPQTTIIIFILRST